MSTSSKKNLPLVLGCVIGLVLAQGAQAQVSMITPAPFTGTIIQIGDSSATADVAFYDNTQATAYFASPPPETNPIIYADDMHWSGTYHVNRMTFGYATFAIGDHAVDVLFYGAVADDLGPDQTVDPVAVLNLTGLPGSPDGTVQGYHVTVDLAGQGLDFDYTASMTSTGDPLTWIGFIFHQNGAGLLLATGGGSTDLFWTDKNLNQPFEDGSFFWSLGGPPNPEGSFYVQLAGVAQ